MVTGAQHGEKINKYLDAHAVRFEPCCDVPVNIVLLGSLTLENLKRV
jgi:hypothetical protein